MVENPFRGKRTEMLRHHTKFKFSQFFSSNESDFVMDPYSGVDRKKFLGEIKVGGSASYGGAPRTPENFRKFAKKFSKKIAKMPYLFLFCRNISKQCGKFSRVWTKNTIVWETLRTF